MLREFYDSVKKSNTLTMNLRQGPAGVISMPEGNKGMEWFELGEWAGMCTHLGGMHLAQLRIMERMARHMGDEAYVQAVPGVARRRHSRHGRRDVGGKLLSELL